MNRLGLLRVFRRSFVVFAPVLIAGKALCNGVDAPMSSEALRVGQVGEDKGVELSYYVPSQATIDLLL